MVHFDCFLSLVQVWYLTPGPKHSKTALFDPKHHFWTYKSQNPPQKSRYFLKVRNFVSHDAGDCQMACLHSKWGLFGRQKRTWATTRPAMPHVMGMHQDGFIAALDTSLGHSNWNGDFRAVGCSVPDLHCPGIWRLFGRSSVASILHRRAHNRGENFPSKALKEVQVATGTVASRGYRRRRTSVKASAGFRRRRAGSALPACAPEGKEPWSYGDKLVPCCVGLAGD